MLSPHKCNTVSRFWLLLAPSRKWRDYRSPYYASAHRVTRTGICRALQGFRRGSGAAMLRTHTCRFVCNKSLLCSFGTLGSCAERISKKKKEHYCAPFSFWWPVRESNPCFQRERLASWPLDQRAVFFTAWLLYHIKNKNAIDFSKIFENFFENDFLPTFKPIFIKQKCRQIRIYLAQLLDFEKNM